MDKTTRFMVFGYQILPTTTSIQYEIDSEIKSYDDLVARKNDIFQDVISNPRLLFKGRGYNVLSKIEYNKGSDFILRMDVKKNVTLSDQDFNEKEESDYPNILVFINNDPTVQTMLIEDNTSAFTSPEAVRNIISKSIKDHLKKRSLTVYIEAKYDSTEFWETLKKYEGKITTLKFDLIKPNMANISNKAVEAIKMLKSNMNSHKTSIGFTAPSKGRLENLNQSNEELKSIVEYSAETGTVPTIKVKGYQKRIKTTKNEKVVKIDELTIKGSSMEELVRVFKGLIK